MPNVFDQFDAPGKSANVFDQFGGGKPTSPEPKEESYTGTILPFRRDESGLHLAVPEAIASPIRGMLSMGQRARGVGEQGQNPLRPLEPDQLAAVTSLAGSPVAGATIGRGMSGLADALSTNSAAKAESAVTNLYTRAVKPTVAGKQSAAQLGQYQDQARDAISSIIANKDALHFTDESGNVISGELPKTLEQFGEAIDQTKAKIFEQYDALAKQAGSKGADVPLGGISTELSKIANDPVVMDLHPELANYAATRAAALQKRGYYSVMDAQRAIQNLNTSLKAFYRNPSFETANRASIDALVANQLRVWLDRSIDATVAPGYQGLKNQYGALKTIEKDVLHRAQIVARQEKGGGLFGRIADVASAEEVIRGVITLSPTALARGAFMKGYAEIVKHLRSPNRAVTKMFDTAEKMQNPPEPRQLPQSYVRFGAYGTPPALGQTFLPSDQDTMQRAASPPQ